MGIDLLDQDGVSPSHVAGAILELEMTLTAVSLCECSLVKHRRNLAFKKLSINAFKKLSINAIY